MVNKEDGLINYKPYCGTCAYRIENHDFFNSAIIEYKNAVTKRAGRLFIKPGNIFCNHPDMYTDKNKPKKINKNHIRWWGFTPECPFNPYSHTCCNCGKRMANENTVCSSCEKILNTMTK